MRSGITGTVTMTAAPERSRRRRSTADEAAPFAAAFAGAGSQVVPCAPLASPPRDLRPDRPTPSASLRLDEAPRRERRRSGR
jgi:hypothetical protein